MVRGAVIGLIRNSVKTRNERVAVDSERTKVEKAAFFDMPLSFCLRRLCARLSCESEDLPRDVLLHVST